MSTTPWTVDALRSPRTGGPLRVLQVCARFLPELGGIETHVDQVSRRLAARGDVAVTVLTTDRARSRPTRESRGGFTVLRVPAWPRERDYYLAPGIFRTIRRGAWDLVHCQGIHTPVPVLAMAAARRARIPYLVTFHTGGHSSNARNALRSAQWRAVGPLVRGATHLVGVSRSEARLFQRLVGVETGRLSVIRNGGGLPLPPQAVEPVPGRIVSSGRLERYKGHHRVIEALPRLRQLVPGAHLEILGAGPFEPELRRIAARLGVAGAVTIRHIDPRDRTAMATALGSAQAVAALSDYEAHPVAVMEALTIGRPVVGYAVAGMADLVEDGLVTGVAPGAGADDTARALAAAMTAPGRVLADLPTWDDCVAALVRVYRSATAGGPPAGQHTAGRGDPPAAGVTTVSVRSSG